MKNAKSRLTQGASGRLKQLRNYFFDRDLAQSQIKILCPIGLTLPLICICIIALDLDDSMSVSINNHAQECYQNEIEHL